tara:strand:+ start:364 stop:558 length:195 start_codon:yes stop_codon:yes gene_type:complete
MEKFTMTKEQIEFLTDLVNDRVENLSEDEHRFGCVPEGRLYEKNVLTEVLRILEGDQANAIQNK